jgi:mannose-6-phosphate isomerase
MLYPLTFRPIFMERVWGGRRLEELYGKTLPPNRPIGESWEIADRPDAVSVIDNGPLAGTDLHWVVRHRADELFGPAFNQERARFPWLIKMLDARDTLSLQVHPPAEIAAELGGEPKTEMWYVTAATSDAAIFAGLKRRITRTEFERRLGDGTVADCVHRIVVTPGDCMFLRSGRVHALGAGCLIVEIQQNSDTTYRVFDWNRLGLDGKPRDLHLEQSMRSIDFDDFEPSLVVPRVEHATYGRNRLLVDDPLFRVEKVEIDADRTMPLEPATLQVVGLLGGSAEVTSPAGAVSLRAGQFALVPACLAESAVVARQPVELLRVRPGSGSDT